MTIFIFMELQLKSIEKLLNTLGTKRLESLYGLKGYKFFVDEFIPQNQFHGGNIIVRTEPKLPITLSIKGEDVGMNKYSNLARLGTNLTSLLKYFEGSGGHKPYILINPEDFKILEDPFKLLPSGKTSFIDHPEEFYEFDNNGTVVHKKTGFVYGLTKNNLLMLGDGAYHLSDIDNDEWFDSFSEKDKQELLRIYG